MPSQERQIRILDPPAVHEDLQSHHPRAAAVSRADRERADARGLRGRRGKPAHHADPLVRAGAGLGAVERRPRLAAGGEGVGEVEEAVAEHLAEFCQALKWPIQYLWPVSWLRRQHGGIS